MSRFSPSYSKITTITSAQVLALFATPQIIVPAPESNLAVLPILSMIYKAAGTAYGGIAAGEDLAIKYSGASGAVCAQGHETTGFLDSASAKFSVAGGIIASVIPVAGAAVYLHMLTGEIITGTSDLIVRVDYHLIPVVLADPAYPVL